MEGYKKLEEKQKWLEGRVKIAEVVNKEVNFRLDSIRQASEWENNDDQVQEEITKLLEIIMDSAKSEYRIGWALSLFRHMRTAGFADTVSISKIMRSN